MKLIFVRHGETFANTMFMIQGQLDTPETQLTPKGWGQALKTGEGLERFLRKEGIEIDTVYSSDLGRASDTCKVAMSFINPMVKNKQIQLRRELREMCSGENEGRKCATHEELHTFGYAPTPSGEAKVDFQNRVMTFMLWTAMTKPDKTVAYFAHGGTIQSLKNGIEGKPGDDFILQSVPPNGGVIMFDVNVDTTSCKLTCNSIETLDIQTGNVTNLLPNGPFTIPVTIPVIATATN